MSICYFERMGGEPTLVVGTAVEATLMPRGCKEGWLRVYAIKDQGRALEFMHKVSRADPSPWRYDWDVMGERLLTPSRQRPTTYQCASPGSRDTCWRALVGRCGCTRWARRHFSASARTR